MASCRREGEDGTCTGALGVQLGAEEQAAAVELPEVQERIPSSLNYRRSRRGRGHEKYHELCYNVPHYGPNEVKAISSFVWLNVLSPCKRQQFPLFNTIAGYWPMYLNNCSSRWSQNTEGKGIYPVNAIAIKPLFLDHLPLMPPLLYHNRRITRTCTINNPFRVKKAIASVRRAPG